MCQILYIYLLLLSTTDLGTSRAMEIGEGDAKHTHMDTNLMIGAVAKWKVTKRYSDEIRNQDSFED